MKSKKYCLSISTYEQSLDILNFYTNSNIIPILHFKYNLVNKLSSNWLFEFIHMLENQYGSNNQDSGGRSIKLSFTVKT